MLLNGPIWGQLTKLNWSYSSPQGAAFMGGGLHGAQHRCADLGWKYLWGCCTSKAFLVLGSAGWLPVSLQFCSLCGVHSVLCFCSSCRERLLPGGQAAYATAEQARLGHQLCGCWERLQKSRPARYRGQNPGLFCANLLSSVGAQRRGFRSQLVSVPGEPLCSLLGITGISSSCRFSTRQRCFPLLGRGSS